MRTRKPRLSRRSFELLRQLDDFIRRFDVRGVNLMTAASDEFDGGVTRDEIDELVRKGFLSVVRDCRSDYPTAPFAQVCGEDGYTVYLTDEAIDRFWPHRKTALRNAA